jgi:hypothetical protein
VRVEHADQDLALAQAALLLLGRPLHLQDDLGGPGLVRAVDERGARVGERLVGDRGAEAGPALDHRLEAERLVALDRVRRGRDTPLVLAALLRDADPHDPTLPSPVGRPTPPGPGPTGPDHGGY